MKKALVISPHLDDAILSAGQFIVGRGDVDVLTVFAGVPMKKGLLTPYDKGCGFKNSKDAMVVRRQEDKEACAVLGANPIHLNYLDSQYTDKRDKGLIWTDLYNYASDKKYELVAIPLGLRHPDHGFISDNLSGCGIKNLFMYEDLPARVTHPELVWRRLRAFPTAELTFIGDGPIADKVRALWCYRSQIGKGELNPYNLYVSERFWKV